MSSWCASPPVRRRDAGDRPGPMMSYFDDDHHRFVRLLQWFWYAVALALVLALGSMLYCGVSLAQSAPCMDAFRCVIHKDTTDAMRRETGTAVYVLGSFAVVSSNAVWGWDHDAGGYPDILYRDKAIEHAASAMILTETAIAMHVRPSFAVLWTNVAGLGFEVSQGRVDKYDLAANALGSLVGLAFMRWVAPLRFR